MPSRCLLGRNNINSMLNIYFRVQYSVRRVFMNVYLLRFSLELVFQSSRVERWRARRAQLPSPLITRYASAPLFFLWQYFLQAVLFYGQEYSFASLHFATVLDVVIVHDIHRAIVIFVRYFRVVRYSLPHYFYPLANLVPNCRNSIFRSLLFFVCTNTAPNCVTPAICTSRRPTVLKSSHAIQVSFAVAPWNP